MKKKPRRSRVFSVHRCNQGESRDEFARKHGQIWEIAYSLVPRMKRGETIRVRVIEELKEGN